MRAGQLRDRVTVQLNTPEHDAYGQEVASWSDVGVFWADVQPRSGSGDVTHVVRMRAGEVAVDRFTHRLVFGDLVLDVLRVVDVDNRGAELRLECQELVDDG